MCVITSAVTGATIAAYAATAATVAGAAVSAYGAYQSGQAQAAQANYQQKLASRNAQQAQYQADYERKAAEENADAHRRTVRSTIGTQRAGLAASGVDISDTDSSAMNILGDTAQWGEYDARKIEHQGELKAWAYENQAANEQANAKLYGMGAQQATTAGAIGAGSSLLSGAGSVANSWYKYNKNS